MKLRVFLALALLGLGVSSVGGVIFCLFYLLVPLISAPDRSLNAVGWLTSIFIIAEGAYFIISYLRKMKRR